MYVEAESLWQNGYFECCNLKFRHEFLNVDEFESVCDAVWVTTNFHRHYNEVFPHSALDYQTPKLFAAVQPLARARQT
nr:transposase [Fuerstiella marisgermanici]